MRSIVPYAVILETRHKFLWTTVFKTFMRAIQSVSWNIVSELTNGIEEVHQLTAKLLSLILSCVMLSVASGKNLAKWNIQFTLMNHLV